MGSHSSDDSVGESEADEEMKNYYDALMREIEESNKKLEQERFEREHEMLMRDRERRKDYGEVVALATQHTGKIKQSDMTIEEIIAKQNGASRKRPSDEEHRIQCACVNWFRYQYPEYRLSLWSVPNGGARSKATAGKLKAEGVLAGVADLQLAVPNYKYNGLFIEMKTRTGRQSEAQKEWQKAQEANGYRYVVCRSLDDFIAEIRMYLG